MKLHALAALAPGKELSVPTEQEAGWGLELICTFLHKSLSSAGNWTLDHPVHSLATTLTEL